MISSIYVTGIKNTDLSPEEQKKLDEHKNKFGSVYNLLDKRNDDFKSIYETYKSEGKNIVLFAEITNVDEDTKNRIIEAAKDLKSTFGDIDIEVNDEEKKLL
jgi:sulfatase maturation enzyme AslB (radical SAM superfamily)